MATQKLNYLDASIMPRRHIGIRRLSQIGVRALMSPTVTVGGTFLTTPTEAEVVTGTQTITFTISNGTWPVTISDAVKEELIAGITGDSGLATGWSALVGVAAASTMARTSDTVLTFTIPATAAYHIFANENLSVAIPRTIMVAGVKMQLIADFATVANASGSTITAALTGTFLTTPTEGEVVTGSQTIIITLTNGTWIPTAGFDAVRQSIINGLTSDGVEETGWNATVRDAMAVTTVVRTSDTAVTVTLPATATYAITAEETVTVTIPRLAMSLADADVVAAETIAIQPD